ncbi:hypothetical protein QTG54_000820 [Skeletonema marinoi]|uniref:Uncharacterized protein n=1 Tax=Skeletonema marinoi TaxID=267567 RepID=A0AAD8YLP2_9STRA|nr:hypothetical protein QTG54_000820 [Skeletonema marinoi]
MVDDAQVLSDYMAKSHEEKLRAIKEVEDKKNSQIALNRTTQIIYPCPSGCSCCRACLYYTRERCRGKTGKLPKFYDEGSELKAEQKFQERLEKLLAASGAALPSSDAAVETQPEPVAELSLFEKRNLQVVAAGENHAGEVWRYRKRPKVSKVSLW